MTLIPTCKQIPMMFLPELVRGIINGTKTMTRRAVPDWQLAQYRPETNSFVALTQRHTKGSDSHGISVHGKTDGECMSKLAELNACPFGNTSDQIWVKEPWGIVSQIDATPARHLNRPSKKVENLRYGQKVYSGDVIYRADGQHEWRGSAVHGEVWHSSMLMPKSAARLFLSVIGNKVERLHSITHDDALDEGTSGVDEFHELWRNLYGIGEWEKNPWVWCVRFQAL